MNEQEMRGLASDIEARLAGSPGVSQVFPADGALAQALGAGARRLGLVEDEAAWVVVRAAGEGLEIDVALGTDGSRAAPSTASAMRDLIRAALPPLVEAHIRLTLVHLEDGSGAERHQP